MNGTKSVTIFSFPGSTVIQAKVGEEGVLIADSAVLASDWNQRYFGQLWQSSCLRQINLVNEKHWKRDSVLNIDDKIVFNNSCLAINNKRFAIVRELPPMIPGKKLKMDYLILADNPKVHVEDLMNYFSFQQLIFASSNYKTKIGEWVKEAERLNIKSFSVPDKGAFNLNW